MKKHILRVFGNCPNCKKPFDIKFLMVLKKDGSVDTLEKVIT